MDDLTNSLIARTYLEAYKPLALEEGQVMIERTLSKWDTLSKLRDFRDFVGGINSMAEGKTPNSTAASVMASRCTSFLIKADIPLKVEPRPAGGGITGLIFKKK